MTDAEDIDNFLDILGDKQARRILETISAESQSAKELAETLDLSLPTVYRRLKSLEEQELVEEDTRLADDGNHYRIYKCNFYSSLIKLEDGEFKARITQDGSVTERLVDIWSEL